MINKFIFDPNHIISTLHHNNFESSLAWTQQHFGILILTFDLLISSNQNKRESFYRPKKSIQNQINFFLLKQSENFSSDHEKPSKMFVRLKEAPTQLSYLHLSLQESFSLKSNQAIKMDKTKFKVGPSNFNLSLTPLFLCLFIW